VLIAALQAELSTGEFQQRFDPMISTSGDDFPPNLWTLFTAVRGPIQAGLLYCGGTLPNAFFYVRAYPTQLVVSVPPLLEYSGVVLKGSTVVDATFHCAARAKP